MKLLHISLLAAITFFPALVTAQALPTESIDRIVAIVEEDVVLKSELDRAVNNIFAQYKDRESALPPRDVLEKQVLDRLIAIRLQVLRAESTGIRIADAEIDGSMQNLAAQNQISIPQLRSSLERDGFDYEEFRATMRDELMVQRLRQRFVQSRIKINDTEIDNLLASETLSTGQVRLSHILIGVPDSANPEQVGASAKKADTVWKEVKDGADFAAAAIRYSDGQQALEGGDLGWRGYDAIPAAFAEQVAKMQLGEVTSPMRGPNGFHMLKLVDQREETQHVVKEFNALHIMIRADEVVSVDAAEAILRGLHQRVVNGEDFGTLAKAQSQDYTSANLNGDMGWFPIDVYGSRVAQVIEGLGDGELSQPFQTEAGWHMIKRMASRDQDRTEEWRRNKAREAIRNRKAEEEYGDYIRQLHAESYIENRLVAAATPEKTKGNGK